jgi:hypothetical protein
MINKQHAILNMIMLVFFCTAIILSGCNAKKAAESSLNTANSLSVLSENNNKVEYEWQDVYEAALKGNNPLEKNYLELEFPKYEDWSEEDYAELIDTGQEFLGAGLYDIDDNGIPELFVKIGLYEGIYYDIYTIENGVLKYLAHSDTGKVEKLTGILFSLAVGHEKNEAYYYEDGELVEMSDYIQSSYGFTSEMFLIGNRVIKDWHSFYYNDDDVFTIEIFKNFSDAINYYLANPVSYFSADLKEKLIQKTDPATYWTTENLNLREAPNTDSERIITVPKGTAVNVIDFMNGGWYQVEYQGKEGYMKAEFLSMAIDYGDDWQKAYEAVLNGYDPSGDKYSELTYEKNAFRDWENQKIFIGSGLHDFDDNGIPELFVFIAHTFGLASNIYTLRDGAVRFLINFPGRTIEKSTNILFCFDDFVEGFCGDEAYRYEDHKFVAIPDYAQTISEDNYVYDVRYYLGGKKYDWDTENVSEIEISANFSDAINFYFYQKNPSEHAYSGKLSFDDINYDMNAKTYTIEGRVARLLPYKTASGAPAYDYGQVVSVTLTSGTMIRSDHSNGQEITIDSIYSDYQLPDTDLKLYPYIYNTEEKTLANIGN